MIRGTAKSSITLEWDGTPVELIEFIDEVSDGALDSLDIGDCMGYVEERVRNSRMGEITWKDGNRTLHAFLTIDTFNWKGIKEGEPTILR